MTPSSARLRIVIDTNLLVSGTFSTVGAPRDVLQSLRRGEFLLLCSEPQTTELADVFERPKITRRSIPESVAELFYLIEAVGIPVSPAELPLSVRDAKDEKILAAALGGDADLLVLDGDPRLGRLRIVTARAFLDILATDREELARDS